MTPAHRPGSRFGRVIGFTSPRRTPVLVEWEPDRRSGKWGAAALLKVVSQDKPERPIGQQDKPRKPPTGWIEERKANPKRANPTTCYYFCWYEVTDGDRRKLKTYVPANQMSDVWQSVKVNKSPHWETLKLIQKRPKPHHTDSPKI